MSNFVLLVLRFQYNIVYSMDRKWKKTCRRNLVPLNQFCVWNCLKTITCRQTIGVEFSDVPRMQYLWFGDVQSEVSISPGAMARNFPREKFDDLFWLKAAVSEQPFFLFFTNFPLSVKTRSPIFNMAHLHRHQGKGIDARAIIVSSRYSEVYARCQCAQSLRLRCRTRLKIVAWNVKVSVAN